MSCFYILKINPLLVSFVNIFSHSLCCLFIEFMVSFTVQKLICLIRIQFFCLPLFLLPWEADLRKHWYDIFQKIFSPFFSL